MRLKILHLVRLCLEFGGDLLYISGVLDGLRGGNALRVALSRRLEIGNLFHRLLILGSKNGEIINLLVEPTSKCLTVRVESLDLVHLHFEFSFGDGARRS